MINCTGTRLQRGERKRGRMKSRGSGRRGRNEEQQLQSSKKEGARETD